MTATEVDMRLAHLPVLALAAAAFSSPTAAQSDSVRIARLGALGRLFGVVKYFHPGFIEHDVPWDSAMVVAIDGVSAARSADEYRAAVAALLASLHDPATRVIAMPRPPVARLKAADRAPSSRWEVTGADSTLIVAVPSFDDYVAALQKLNSAAADIRRAPSLVFDLRGDEPDDRGTATFVFASSVQSFLPATTISAPAHRRRMHSGFPPQQGGTSGGYWSGTYEMSGMSIRAAPNNRSRRIVFLVRPESDIPDVALALRANGQAAIVVEGTTGALAVTGDSYSVALGDSLLATVRTGELAPAADADTVVPPAASSAAGTADVALRVAIAFSKRPPTPPVATRPAGVAHAATENPYPGMRYPGPSYRILAVYRYWNAIHYFYPYKHLIGEDWGAVLPRSLRLVDSARDSLEFAKALATMVTYTRDSHSGVTGNVALSAWIGRLPVAVDLQYVDGQPVVIRIGDDSATKASGIAVGDIIVTVDGEDAAARRSRIAPLLASSTPQALDYGVSWRLLRGNDSAANLTVRGADNRDRAVRLPRRQAFAQLMQYPRSGPVMRVLRDNIGYADLSLLTPAMVDSMFELFKNTKGIILDDRGYPQGTAWAIAPRLNPAGAPAADFRRPLVMSPDSSEWTTYHFVQRTPTGSKWPYRGKTVLLVDERTISQAEHTGLFFEAANKTTIVGSPTMGANGDVTTVALVGGMYATFTGHDVRHADGRQLQRVGLQPDIVVRPTLAGIRAGRDEVLERALAVFSPR